MSDAPALSPEVSRSIQPLARTLVAAVHSWASYPPEPPAVRGSLDRWRAAIAGANSGQMLPRGVTLDTLPVAGVPVEGREAAPIGGAAKASPIATSSSVRSLASKRCVPATIQGSRTGESMLAHTWEPDGRGDCTSVDPELAGIDPLNDM